MRVTYKELMNLLGVGDELHAYETCPWSVYSDEREATCSAEVRAGPSLDYLEAELQVFYDIPPEGKAPLEQVFIAHFIPVIGTTDKWSCDAIAVKGNTNEKNIYGWEEKGCKFFEACVQEIKMGNFPDIDAIYEREITDFERFSDQYGGGGSKSPKMNMQPNQSYKTGM